MWPSFWNHVNKIQEVCSLYINKNKCKALTQASISLHLSLSLPVSPPFSLSFSSTFTGDTLSVNALLPYHLPSHWILLILSCIPGSEYIDWLIPLFISWPWKNPQSITNCYCILKLKAYICLWHIFAKLGVFKNL